MRLSLRAALMVGALIASSEAALAEPVTLAQALTQGAEHSPRVAQAKAKAEAAQARARQAGASPNPELSVEVENFAGTGVFQGFRSMETTLALSQRLELGGKRGARVAVASAERDFASLSFRAAMADLAREIRVSHAELRAAEERALLARANVAQARELARSAKELVEAGRDPPLRQLRAEAVLAEAKAEEARSFGDLLAARRMLADLMGSNDPELSATVVADETAPAVLEQETPSLDEQLATAERDAALARVRVARSDAVPDITASGGVRRMNDGRETAVVAGFSIPLPFWDRNRGAIEAAHAEGLASEAALAQVRLDARRAQHDARMLLGAADARVEALTGPALAQADEAVRLAQIGYGAGKFSLVELLDAQAALTTAKLALIEARLDRARALAALIRANAQ
ncbi:MAG: TolC family protein [Novosphingobium sp.]|nr:TolC family protein [Novosphingobium sp.]